MNFKYTICIPTYNRVVFLEETLKSVVSEVLSQKDADNSIDVIICDNASSDTTQKLCMEFCKKYEFIKYILNEKNVGIDRNMQKCTTLGSGDYVQILSDDDILIPGSLQRIFEMIDQHKPVFLFLNGGSFEGNFNKKNKLDSVFDTSNDIIFDDKDEFVEKLWIWATFVSSYVFRRDVWLSVKNTERFLDTDIYLTYLLFTVLSISNKEKFVFIANECIAIRSQFTGNYRIFYAFAHQWNILLTDYAVKIGYEKNTMVRILNKTIRNDTFRRIYSVRVHSKSVITLTDLKYIINMTYRYPLAWAVVPSLLLAPVSILRYIDKNRRLKVQERNLK